MWENSVVWWVRSWCVNEVIWVVLLLCLRQYSRLEAKSPHIFVSGPSHLSGLFRF